MIISIIYAVRRVVQGTFDLAVKRYDDGPLSRYIHELDVGQVVEMKGPKGEFVYTPGKWTTIAMICAGTNPPPPKAFSTTDESSPSSLAPQAPGSRPCCR
jgi:ferredoxin-NADP reductase